jgi:hypothetical protein
MFEDTTADRLITRLKDDLESRTQGRMRSHSGDIHNVYSPGNRDRSVAVATGCRRVGVRLPTEEFCASSASVVGRPQPRLSRYRKDGTSETQGKLQFMLTQNY